MAISDADKNELERLNKKLTATDTVRKNTEQQINTILAKGYAGKNLILCKRLLPQETSIVPLALPDDSNKIMPNSRIERLRQSQMQKTFYYNLKYFACNKNGYYLKSDKSMAVIFCFKENSIAYHGVDTPDSRTAMAIAELASKKLRWSSVELHGNDKFINAITPALQKYNVKISMPPTEPQDTATVTTPLSNLLKPTKRIIR